MCKCCEHENSEEIDLSEHTLDLRWERSELVESFRHLQFTNHETGQRSGGITALIVLDKDFNRVHFAYAFCVPADHFTKSIGRGVARDAFAHDEFISFNINPDHPVHTIKEQIDTLVFGPALIAFDFEVRPLPMWFRKTRERLFQTVLKIAEDIDWAAVNK